MTRLSVGFADYDDADGDLDFVDGVAVVNTAVCERNTAYDRLSQDNIEKSEGWGLYPFWTQTGYGGGIPMAPGGVPVTTGRMGLDMMTYYLAKGEVLDRDRLVEGAQAADPVPILTSIEDWAIAVRSGVVSPIGQDRGGLRTLTEFPIVVSEQAGPLGEGGEVADVKMGVPGDARTKVEFVEALPHRPIDPNHAHLMVVTFYESTPVGFLGVGGYRGRDGGGL